MILLKFWGESHASHNIDPRFDSQLSRCSLEVNGQRPTLGSVTYVHSIVLFCGIVFLFRQHSVCCCIVLLLHLID